MQLSPSHMYNIAGWNQSTIICLGSINHKIFIICASVIILAASYEFDILCFHFYDKNMKVNQSLFSTFFS